MQRQREQLYVEGLGYVYGLNDPAKAYNWWLHWMIDKYLLEREQRCNIIFLSSIANSVYSRNEGPIEW